jgi:hypothetical protein
MIRRMLTSKIQSDAFFIHFAIRHYGDGKVNAHAPDASEKDWLFRHFRFRDGAKAKRPADLSGF